DEREGLILPGLQGQFDVAPALQGTAPPRIIAPTNASHRETSVSQWTYRTARELSSALLAKKVSAVELAQDAIAQIERHDAKINAICVRDFSRALDAARTADEAIAKRTTRPLTGIPITVKESYNIAGLKTT